METEKNMKKTAGLQILRSTENRIYVLLLRQNSSEISI